MFSLVWNFNEIGRKMAVTAQWFCDNSDGTTGDCTLLHLYLFLNRGGRRSTTDDFTTSFLQYSVLSTACPLGLDELQALSLIHI